MNRRKVLARLDTIRYDTIRYDTIRYDMAGQIIVTINIVMINRACHALHCD